MSRFAVGKWTPLHAVSVSGVRGSALEYKGAFYWKCIKWDHVFRTVSHEGQFNLMAGCTGLRGRRLGSLLTSCVIFRNVRDGSWACLSSGLLWGWNDSAQHSAHSKHSVLGNPFLGLNVVKLSRLAVSLLRSTQLWGWETRYSTVTVSVLSQKSVFLFLPVFVPRHCLKPCSNESSYSHTTSYSHLLDF